MATPGGAPTFFASAAAFGDWLERHAAGRAELLVGFRKVGTGRASMSASESVDEAWCHGWIDGVRRRVDDTAHTIRFTPSRARSKRSAINVAETRAARLARLVQACAAGVGLR